MVYCFHCMNLLKEGQEICPSCGKRIQDTQANERTLPPGTILADKYLLGEVIGEGGFGITYRGIDLNLQLKVAVKEYFPASFASRSIRGGTSYELHVIKGESESFYQKGLEDYAKEANRLSQFASLPGIVSVLNFFYENNTAYMVMEYVDGITISEYLNSHKGRLSWQETLELLHPVILSLAQIHRAGIIHRDISPDNIMLTRDGQIKLIDFGAARKVDGNQGKKTVILKRGYAPLEQYRTDSNQGPWSDVYSLCATIYRMVGGQKYSDAMAVAGGSVRIVPLKELAKDVPDFLDAAIMRGLEIKISDRIQSMEELESYLYQGKRIRKRAGKRKWVMAGAASGCVILLVVSILVFKALSEKPENKRNTEESVSNENITEERNREEEEPRERKGADNGEEGTQLDDSYEDLPDTPDLTYDDMGDAVVITGADYSVTEVVIPGQIDGKPVREIAGMSPNAVRVVIKQGVEKIAAGAFRNCVYLESVYIPASVTEIEDGAFENCMVLSEILVSEENSNFYSEDGKLYRRDGTLVFGN